jgi:radical SAM protein with 4Fe4S-binding SPASM domain
MVLPVPRYVQLYPTVRCNQHCFFCFNGPLSRSGAFLPDAAGELPDLSFPGALRLLEILEDQGIREIDVMGGEPMLLHWMPDFVNMAAKRGMDINISTNGSRPETISEFKDSDRERITIGVSLEGSSGERHNSITGSSHFSLAVNTIETLLSLDFDVPVKTVVSRKTAPDIGNIIGILRTLGIRRYYLIHMDILTRDPAIMNGALSFPEFRSFSDHIRETNRDMEICTVSASCFTKKMIGIPALCSGGVNKLSVLPDGSAFPCNLFHRFPAFLLGNILQDDFSSIWTNPRLDAFREPTPHACDDALCVNKTSCTGGCPAHNLYHHGDLHGRDVRCGPPGGM